jgi:hypothetical protein
LHQKIFVAAPRPGTIEEKTDCRKPTALLPPVLGILDAPTRAAC